MPTDFTIASEYITIFEKDILSLSNLNDKTKILNFISEITSKNLILKTYFPKFHKRIESGLYNENMKWFYPMCLQPYTSYIDLSFLAMMTHMS